MTVRDPAKGRATHTGLTVEDVRLIRRAIVEGVAKRELADRFGCGVETIRRIGRNETFAWLEWARDELPPERSAQRKFVETAEYQKKKALADQAYRELFEEDGETLKDTRQVLDPATYDQVAKYGADMSRYVRGEE